jgi:hypothetical protein
MYTKINGIPAQDFCDWYNKNHNSVITPDDIEFVFSYYELEYLADKASDEIGWKYDDLTNLGKDVIIRSQQEGASA